jgi:hypothetical protein
MIGPVLIVALFAAPMRALAGEEPDARLLRSGEFVYGDFRGEDPLGRSRILIAREPGGRYRFSNTVIGNSAQAWTAVAMANFEPISAVLEFRGEDGTHQPIFEIRYRGDRVSGTRHLRQSTGVAPVAVDDAVEAGVIDQRIDWASVMARKLEVGLKFNFQVYDPAIATSVGVAMVEDGGRVHVPAGDFDTFKITYRIGKKSGLEQYVVYASKAVPRIMVREDFPDGLASKLEIVASTP